MPMVLQSTRIVTKPHRMVIFMLLKVLWSCLPCGNNVLPCPFPLFTVVVGCPPPGPPLSLLHF
ncbi:hypothetical protein ACB092_12G147300 [Castanea dentata]